jgi:hypothetical protein
VTNDEGRYSASLALPIYFIFFHQQQTSTPREGGLL